ncbi:hypothetical protein P154DRAFT_250307 [Amniculicola lignicola CBS 123094]|uniref:Uncharacterized protein n=1 Tax=Amniculicola lignicola CBS 123094 TaxID=1392246 RepID=A0A6A5W8Z8_9PLEO|nr:hypothetical protein P154DRAFT_250307 [Amniculicola lignicola CBS 123094]
MAALLMAPPRTPSPKIRIHRSQSFNSPSSRLSITPIDDAPYTKSASNLPLARPLPAYDALKAAESAMVAQRHGFGRGNVILHTKMSDEDMDMDMSDTDSDGLSSINSSPTSPNSPGSDSPFGLFATGSPTLPPAPSPSLSPSPSLHSEPYTPTAPLLSRIHAPDIYPPSILPASSSLSIDIFQDPTSPMFDPWLVRVVLDMFDIRGMNWMMIAHWVERGWSVRTNSAEVLGILEANGRIRGRVWWD